MAIAYNDCATALTWELLNEVEDIGNWVLRLEDGRELNGKGFEQLLSNVGRLSNKTTVVYTKHLRWLIHIGGKYMDYGADDCDFFGSMGKQGTRFFYLRSGNVEFREWDNFFSKVEDRGEFLDLLGIMREYFKSNLKTKMKLTHCKYTFARDMWEDIAYENYLKAPWARTIVNDMLPQDMEEFNLYDDFNKGGYFFGNPDWCNKKVENLHQYDRKSSYLASAATCKYPVEAFKEEEDDENIQHIIKDDSYCWIGRFIFTGLKKKIDLPIDFTGGSNNWCERYNDDFIVVLNNVDMKWWKKVFEWEECYIVKFYYAKHNYLCKDLLKCVDTLFAQKEAAITPYQKMIYKPRTELFYGQSIKGVMNTDTFIWNEKEQKFDTIENKQELTIEEVQRQLKKRYLPYQYGIWTCSWSRLEEIEMILRIGVENVVYGDTDSVKFIGDEGIEIVKQRNEEIKKQLEYVGKKRVILFDEKLGMWKDEGIATEFKFINPKWYCEIVDGEIKVKAAGGSTENIKKALEKKVNPVNAFNKWMKVDKMMTFYRPSKTMKYGVEIQALNGVDKELLSEGYKKMNGTWIEKKEEELLCAEVIG